MLISASFIVFLVGLDTIAGLNEQPLIISHRAASGYLPEQTLESELMAYMLNTDLIEIDVILSADNRLIVTHDVTIDDTTNVRYVYPNRSRTDSRYYVMDFTYDELKRLNVSERFKDRVALTSPKYPNRFPLWKSYFHLHAFEEAIELIDGLHKTLPLHKNGKAKNVSFLIEIKRPHFHTLQNKTNLSEIVLSVLDRYGYNTASSPFIIQSFDPYELQRIRAKTPLRIVQLLLTNEEVEYEEDINRVNYTYWSSANGLKQISTYAVGIATQKNMLIDLTGGNQNIKPSLMYNDARALGLLVYAWTFRKDDLPNYAQTYDGLLNIFSQTVRLDGIITDHPAETIIYYDATQKASFLKIEMLLFVLSVSVSLAVPYF